MANNKVELESLKGIYDRYPNEWATWKKIIETVEETANEFGFRHIDPPSIERQELWTSKDNEEIVEQMYAFEDKGENKVTLIPEQTPTRARLVQKRKDLKTPMKWYCTSKRWRYEDVTRGRDREFRQGDFDIFGVNSVEADAEVIAAAATIYKKLGLQDRVVFKISDRKIVEGCLELNNVPNVEEVMKVIDDEEKISRKEFIEELEELKLQQEDIKTVDSLLDVSGSNLQQQLNELEDIAPEQLKQRVERMKSLVDALKSYGVSEMVEIDFSIVRGLAYYTGLVFEAFDEEGELRALFGGGRYDELVEEFGDRTVPAVGFGFGYSTTVELLKKSGSYPLKQVETEVYVLTVSNSVKNKALDYARRLRKKGLTVETDLQGRGFGSQLEYADSINAERALIVGERDLENNQVTMKHMESGKEEKIGENEVLKHLKEEDFF